jgi:hypothetical protein
MNDGRPKLGAVGPGGPGSNDRIDRAIDRAVRAMVQIDPPAGLRRRVLSRLDAPLRAPLVPRFAFAAAALAVLVLAVLVVRRGAPGDTTRTPVSNPAATQASAPQAAPPAPAPGPEAGHGNADAAVQPSSSPKPTTRPTLRGKPIEMPPVANIFGPPTGRVASATIANVAPPTPAEDSPAPGSAPAGGLAPLTIVPLDLPPLILAPLPSRK